MRCVCPCFDRLRFANVGTEKHEGLPSPGVAVRKRPCSKGILICKSILVPFPVPFLVPVCGIEVNSAEETNRGKLPFLLGYCHGCAEESAGCFFGWFLAQGSRSAGVVWGRRAQGSHCGHLALPALLGSFPCEVNGLRLGLTLSCPVRDDERWKSERRLSWLSLWDGWGLWVLWLLPLTLTSRGGDNLSSYHLFLIRKYLIV